MNKIKAKLKYKANSFEILEQGDHDLLLKNKGFYFDIFKKQQLDSN
jgi:ABC-type multidrug transport system fused ATPase/permease subunit